MIDSDRRIACIRLLAKLDQEIREAELLSVNPLLDATERRTAAVHLEFRRQALERVERMLKVAALE